MIYLDNNATTSIDPDAVSAMNAQWAAGALNASSQHAAGRSAKARLNNSLDVILDCLSASSHRFIVTSGGTEANNWAVAHLGEGDGPIIVSQTEHPSVLEAAHRTEASGRPVRYLPVNCQGVVELQTLASWLAETPIPRLVSIMVANNETGVIQPISDIVSMCQNAGVPFHTDASQVIGKLPFNINDLNVSAATIAAHKFHGPIGVGGLVVRKGIPIAPMFSGGSQQLGYRPGTEPVALVAGMAAAISKWHASSNQIGDDMLGQRNQLEDGLRNAIPDSIIIASETDRLPQTTSFAIPGVDRQALLMSLDFAGIACSTGSACTSGSSEPSHVLQAMGLPKNIIESTIRLSASKYTSEQEISDSIDRIANCCNKLRSK